MTIDERLSILEKRVHCYRLGVVALAAAFLLTVGVAAQAVNLGDAVCKTIEVRDRKNQALFKVDANGNVTIEGRLTVKRDIISQQTIHAGTAFEIKTDSDIARLAKNYLAFERIVDEKAVPEAKLIVNPAGSCQLFLGQTMANDAHFVASGHSVNNNTGGAGIRLSDGQGHAIVAKADNGGVSREHGISLFRDRISIDVDPRDVAKIQVRNTTGIKVIQ